MWISSIILTQFHHLSDYDQSYFSVRVIIWVHASFTHDDGLAFQELRPANIGKAMCDEVYGGLFGQRLAKTGSFEASPTNLKSRQPMHTDGAVVTPSLVRFHDLTSLGRASGWVGCGD